MISLRQIEKYDLGMLKEWRNSKFVRPFVREYRLLNDSDQEAWYHSYLESRRKADFDQEIYIISNHGISVGCGGFTKIEWKNRKAELTFYISGQEGECRGAWWLERDALELILDRGFKEFGFHKIYWPIYSHDDNLQFYKTIFEEEAVLKEEYWWNGQWSDRIYLSKILKEKSDKK